MSDNEQTATKQGVSELELLKQRARMMGITFSNNIGLESLRERVNAKMAADGKVDADEPGETEDDNDDDNDENGAEPNGFEAAAEVADQKDTTPAPGTNQVDTDKDGHDDRDGKFVDGNQEGKKARPLTALEKKAQKRQKLVKEQMKLVRCRIQNLDPKKANLPGEIFTVANKVLGTVRKFVPYGEVTEDGYHIPYIIYRQLESRRFLNIRTIKDRRTGHIRVESSWAKEFAIEVLPPLTQEELDKLANAQKAAGSVGN